MTIGDFLTIYERNHVAFLKNSLGTSRRLQKFPKHSRNRFIQTNEMPYLLASIGEASLRDQGYFLTLLLTGCRRDEARTMQWKDVDLERGLWHKPTTKTGVPHTVPLPAR